MLDRLERAPRALILRVQNVNRRNYTVVPIELLTDEELAFYFGAGDARGGELLSAPAALGA